MTFDLESTHAPTQNTAYYATTATELYKYSIQISYLLFTSYHIM